MIPALSNRYHYGDIPSGFVATEHTWALLEKMSCQRLLLRLPKAQLQRIQQLQLP